MFLGGDKRNWRQCQATEAFLFTHPPQWPKQTRSRLFFPGIAINYVLSFSKENVSFRKRVMADEHFSLIRWNPVQPFFSKTNKGPKFNIKFMVSNNASFVAIRLS
jgi:hypothetical protein